MRCLQEYQNLGWKFLVEEPLKIRGDGSQHSWQLSQPLLGDTIERLSDHSHGHGHGCPESKAALPCFDLL